MITKAFLTLAAILTFLSVVAFGQNYKIKQTTSINGQKSESTIYVKGSRKRTEGGGVMGIGSDVTTLEQCDLKRTVKFNDKKKQYFIDPFAESSGDDTAAPSRPTAAAGGKVVKGGTLTMTSSINDTGERKQMFGLTARHIKMTMKMESSPDACSKTNMQMETDGWYVDLPQFSCPADRTSSSIPYQPPTRGGCQDRMVVRQTGGGKLGFPLQVTQTMSNSDSEQVDFSQTTETIEFSKATLDDALFEVPANYTLARSSQDLYGQPDFAPMMRDSQNDDDTATARTNPSNSGNNPTTSAKRPGMKRIGVIVPTNRSGENISTTNLQSFLVQNLTGGNVDAVAVGSEADARAAGCDFVLTSDLSKLKRTSTGMFGGIMGKVTGTDTSASQTFDAQVDFKLVSIADGRNVLQNKAVNRAPGNVDRVAETVLALEASAVLQAVR